MYHFLNRLAVTVSTRVIWLIASSCSHGFSFKGTEVMAAKIPLPDPLLTVSILLVIRITSEFPVITGLQENCKGLRGNGRCHFLGKPMDRSPGNTLSHHRMQY